ncbi:TonB family protein [Acetobacter sp. AAB5]|uniref:TonB family protein n=1 Tax=Acetobacter sp. AAB5 TaxID=3418370 RepID=UPI003CF471B6
MVLKTRIFSALGLLCLAGCATSGSVPGGHVATAPQAIAPVQPPASATASGAGNPALSADKPSLLNVTSLSPSWGEVYCAQDIRKLAVQLPLQQDDKDYIAKSLKNAKPLQACFIYSRPAPAPAQPLLTADGQSNGLVVMSMYVLTGADLADTAALSFNSQTYSRFLLGLQWPKNQPTAGVSVQLLADTPNKQHYNFPLVFANDTPQKMFGIFLPIATAQEIAKAPRLSVKVKVPGQAAYTLNYGTEGLSKSLETLYNWRHTTEDKDEYAVINAMPAADKTVRLNRINTAAPVYPAAEENKNLEGRVMARCDITAAGAPTNCVVLKTMGGANFTKSALTYLHQVRFALSGNNVSDGVKGHVFTVRFKLD